VTAGSGNLYVTITGSGFVAGAVARWNGAERTSYFIDSSHLKVAIPASDVSSAGTGSLTVLNPGAAAPSGAVTVTIN
jgi:trimeric autotransporter adhesin